MGNSQIALSPRGSDQGVNTVVVLLPETKHELMIFTYIDEGYKIYDLIINRYLGEAEKTIVEIETN